MASRPQISFIDCHTHIGRLPGILGDEYSADDLCYIAEREGAACMLASSASVMVVSRAALEKTLYQNTCRVFGIQ